MWVSKASSQTLLQTRRVNRLPNADGQIVHATLTVMVRRAYLPRTRIGMSTWGASRMTILGTASMHVRSEAEALTDAAPSHNRCRHAG